MGYEMGGTILSKTVKEKDLGVTIIIIIIIQLYFRPQWVHRKDNTNIQG